MINKPWGQITKEDIERLVAEAVPESHTLDYKQELPNESPKSRLDFLADVVAFANASGGDLIFGIEEKREEGKPTATPSGFVRLRIPGTWDEAKRRLESLIRSGIEPKLDVKIDHFEGLPEGPALIVRVPQSWAAPHMVTLYTKDTLRPQFYKRHNGGNHPMDVGEIRAAFSLSETRIERLRRFREERTSLIKAQDDIVPKVYGAGPRYILHLLPVTAHEYATVDISKLAGRKWGPSPAFPYSRWRHQSFNFEGLLIKDLAPSSNELRSYVQIFRHGAIEAVKALENQGYIDNQVEPVIVRRVRDYLKIQQELDVQPPIFIMLNLLGVKGIPVIPPSHANYPQGGEDIDREFLPLPECAIEDFGTPVERALRPAFDALYQSAGMPRSFNYDEDGNWLGESYLSD